VISVRSAYVENYSICGQFVIALNVGADVRSVLANPLVCLFLFVLNLHPAAEGSELARYRHKRHRLLRKQISDVDVDFSTHGTGLHFDPAWIASDMTISALHYGRKSYSGADGTFKVGFQVLRQRDGGTLSILAP